MWPNRPALFIFLFLLAWFDGTQARAFRQQIFSLSRQSLRSGLLNADGQAAYIVSNQGTNRGLLLTKVASPGLAEKAGMAEGDVLLNLNGHVIDSAGAADRLLGQLPSGPLKVMFARQGDNGLAVYAPTLAYENNVRALPPQDGVWHPGPLASNPKSRFNEGEAVPQLESYMVQIINAERTKFGLPTLAVNNAVAAVARTYAQDMAKRGFKGHIDPEGRNPTTRGAAAGLDYPLGENLGWFKGQSPTVELRKIHEMMMAEPPNDPNNHRGNLLNAKYKSVGVGVAFNAKTGELNCVEDFAAVP